jgi:[ribosomal protein S18]-alanine N-acetyltransferase
MIPIPPNMRIRPMTPADLDPVIKIERRLQQAPHWPRAAWLSALDSSSSQHRLALVATFHQTNDLAGFAVAGLLPPQAELEMIAVAPEFQRRGLARFLFAALAQEMKSAQVTDVILEVRASNHPALALYRCLGFVETARRPRYYAEPVEDAVLLSLRLP